MRAPSRLTGPILLCTFLCGALVVCGSKASNAGVTVGVTDTHCVGVDPQEANNCACDNVLSSDLCTSASTPSTTAADGNSSGMTSDYKATMYGTEGDDDDCKYHVRWSASTASEHANTTFTVSATRLVEGTPLKNAVPRAEVFLNENHPAPNTTQSVVENPPGTYTISPIAFDAPGIWTVRFHFFELCDDTQDNSEHGHAAFYFTVP